MAICHTLVRKVAIGIANELYEAAAKDNAFYQRWPSRAHFVNLAWPGAIGEARATLARMLAGPLDESVKREIQQALILDFQLRPSAYRNSPGALQ